MLHFLGENYTQDDWDAILDKGRKKWTKLREDDQITLKRNGVQIQCISYDILSWFDFKYVDFLKNMPIN